MPVGSGDAELRFLLSRERRRLVEEIARLKRLVRSTVNAIEAAEERLHQIELSEDYLAEGAE
jgi:transcription elongation GreA/GreB family factor